MGLAGSSARNGEILTGEMHQTSVYGCASGHNSVRWQFLVGHPKIGGAMAGKHPNLLKAVLILQLCHSFPRRQLAGFMLFVDAIFAATEFQFGTLCAKFGDLFRHRRCLRALYLTCHSCSPVSRNELEIASVVPEPLFPSALYR